MLFTRLSCIKKECRIEFRKNEKRDDKRYNISFMKMSLVIEEMPCMFLEFRELMFHSHAFVKISSNL
jgi:hypothetical protein